MAKKIDPRLVDLLKAYGEDNTSVWDCHGTWVAYHVAIERMAARAGVVFDMPQMIVNDPDKKNVVISVSASMGEKREWSFGEVSPANNKNAYPYAMAEKRAKDRVALKLLGMAGLAYSEEEADDFKASKPSQLTEALHAANTSSASAMPPPMQSLWDELSSITTARGLQIYWGDNAKTINGFPPEHKGRFVAKKDALKADFERSAETLMAGE